MSAERTGGYEGESEDDRTFLGTGLAFPVGTTDAGEFELASGETDIEQSIRLVLGTAPGERVMRPEFGCSVHDHVFATLDAATVAMVESSVEEALVRWEPRIEVQDVTASRGGVAGGDLTVAIAYRVVSTNSEFNLVYPFYLQES